MTELVVARHNRKAVWSYWTGQHMPTPYLVDGRWRCHDCGRRLNRYQEAGVTRLRHYWRDR